MFRNASRAALFYEKVFGVKPQKQTTDYAKFDLQTPALNLALVSSTGAASAVNHLGIEVDSTEDLVMWKMRPEEQGILERVEENVACCFARQDKVWFADPDGNAWEVFVMFEQLEVTGSLKSTGCCVPKGRASSTSTTCAP